MHCQIISLYIVLQSWKPTYLVYHPIFLFWHIVGIWLVWLCSLISFVGTLAKFVGVNALTVNSNSLPVLPYPSLWIPKCQSAWKGSWNNSLSSHPSMHLWAGTLNSSLAKGLILKSYLQLEHQAFLYGRFFKKKVGLLRGVWTGLSTPQSCVCLDY